ncbi:MAG: ferritin-like domain-containing protein [Thermoleophilia bacterium]
MRDEAPTAELLELLNQAIARELQVSIQYMFQHAIGTGREAAVPGKTPEAKQSRFVGSHAPYWLPGARLKKIAITEMRHAEAIAERVVSLGGEPTTQPDTIELGTTMLEMLTKDRQLEREAIELYGKIIQVAEAVGDEVTEKLFRRILSDEEGHHRLFSDLLGEA